MAVVGNAGNSTIQVTEGSGASLVILIAMIILFGGAAYFTGRLYGKVGTPYWKRPRSGPIQHHHAE